MNDLTPISGWPLVLIVSLICLKLVRWVTGKWENEKFKTNTLGKILELSIIAGTAYQLSSVPVVATAVAGLRNLIGTLANTIGPGNAAGVAIFIGFVLVIWMASLYWKSDNEWWTLLFAFAILALSAAVPELVRYMGFAWILVVWIWNIVFAIAMWMANPFGASAAATAGLARVKKLFI